MWPSRPLPATLVSLGTGSGFHRQPESRSGQRRRSWTRGFAFRLYDSFMASMDAEQAWNELLGQLDEAHKRHYHRLNVVFPGQEPLLNAAGQVKWMTDLVDRTASIQVPPVLTSLALASLFLELPSAPRWEEGQLHCVGAIRCRLKGNVLVDLLRKFHPQASTYVIGAVKLDISPSEDAICSSCSRYCVPVRFAVEGHDSQIALALELNTNEQQLLGGFPVSLRWLLERQGFEWTNYATDWTDVPGRTECKACDLRINRKSALAQPSRRYRKRVRFI
jgi:hypothetical protein